MAEDPDLKARLLAVLEEAGRPLTQDELFAVMALRNCADHDLAVAAMILEGKLTAELSTDAADAMNPASYVLKAT